MISDEPDEDADTLDDESLLDNFVGPHGGNVAERGAPKPLSDAIGAASVVDWPPRFTRQLQSDINVGTREWFKANHDDWRSVMEDVLRAWIIARSHEQPDVLLRG